MIDIFQNETNLDECHDLVEKILSESSHPFIMSQLLEEIFSKNNLTNKDKNKIVTSISKSTGDRQAYYAAFVGAYSKLPNDKLVRTTEIISKSKGEDQACHAADIALDNNMLNRDEVLDLVLAVSKSNGKYQAYYGSKVARDKRVIESGNVIPLTVITCETSEYYQAERAAMVCLNSDIINNNVLFYTDVVSRSKNELDAKESSKIATNNFIDSVNKELALRKIFKKSS